MSEPAPSPFSANIPHVNPAHLEAVTHKENLQRMSARMTHCRRGHEFTAQNTRTLKSGKRICRTCQKWGRIAKEEGYSSLKEFLG